MSIQPPALEDSCASARPRLAAAAVVLFLAALSTYQPAVLPLMGSGLKDYLGIDDARLGLLLSIGLLPSAAVGLASGLLVTRLGSRRMVWGSAVALGASSFVVAAAGARWAAVLLGAGAVVACYNALFVASGVYLAALFPDRRRGVLAAFTAVFSVGGIAFPLIAEHAMGVSAKASQIHFAALFHGPYWIIAAATLAGAAWFVFAAPAAAEPPATDFRPRGLRISARSAVLLAGLISVGAGDGLVSLWLPQVLGSSSYAAGLGPLRPGHVMSLFSLAILLSRVVLSLLPERRARWSLAALPALVGGSVFLAGVLTRSPAGIVAGFLAGACLWPLQMPTTLAVLAAREGPRFGWIVPAHLVGVSVSAFLLTNAVASWATTLPEASRWVTLLPACAAYIIGGALCLAASVRRAG